MPKKKFDEVYQFRIVLSEIEPPVWRRIQVPSTYTFWDLHMAIQDVMGWTDTHLHEFYVTDQDTGDEVRIGIPDDESDGEEEILPGWKKKIASYFTDPESEAEYVYDFGDNWIHLVTFEKILPVARGMQYPACVDGERACPPEDCGGTDGYQEFLDAIMDPAHERHHEMLEWCGGDFAPEEFDCTLVEFEDPSVRLKMLKDQF